MSYLPILPRVRDRVNAYLRGMAARGFGVTEPMLREACTTRPCDEWPEGVFERDGKLMFVCRSCDQAVPLECDLTEYDPEVAYCGGSPRCLP